MKQEFKILMVEDQPADTELLVRQLRGGGLKFSCERVDTQSAYHQALRVFEPDLILSDFTMPAFDGLSALLMARAFSPDIPFIFVSGTIGEDRALEALQH